MVAGRLPHYNVRRAIVRKTGRTFVDCEFLDRRGEPIVRCPIPHPIAGQRGGGIFFGPEVGQQVLIARGPMETPFIVQVLPNRELYFDSGGVEDTSVSTTPYPQNIKPGEICIKSPLNSKVFLFDNGNISLSSNIGRYSSNLELSKLSKAIYARTNNFYKFTEAGRYIEGVIRRNTSSLETERQAGPLNYLEGESYDSILKPIGRSPKSRTSYRTTTLSKPVKRNPALIEKRNITYEYAESYNVRNIERELSAMESSSPDNPGEGFRNLTRNDSARQERRTDILNINLNNYNHLIEKVEGTLVDIYGNVLDLNRNIVNLPDMSVIEASNSTLIKDTLLELYNKLRRSVKLHYEINSRKSLLSDEPSVDVESDPQLKDFSKFSIDIDGEGLTKINIPASSETGNIPVLSRYVNSKNEEDPSDGFFRDPERRDVRIIPFSKEGPEISDSVYSPVSSTESVIYAGTAHHSIFNTASSIFLKGKHNGTNLADDELKRVRDRFVDGDTDEGIANRTVSTILYNGLDDPKANAGGRSLNLNLDGSAEISIGADSADKKSMVLDMQGSLISHFGADKRGRSIVHQSDGDTLIQLGNNDSEESKRPGRLEIHLVRPEGEPQIIIIDEDGITVDIKGNAVYSSTGDMTLSCGGQMLIHGDTIGFFGSHDESITGSRDGYGYERFMARNGRIIA